MKLKPSILFGSLLLVIAMLASPAHAADKKDNRQREAARRMAQMRQQMEAEKAELQAGFDKEKAALQQAVEKAALDAREFKAGAAASSHRNKLLEADMEALKKEKLAQDGKQQQTEARLKEAQSALEAAQKKLADLTSQYQDAQGQIRAGIADKKVQAGKLAQAEQRLAVSGEKNARLYGLGRELIDYSDQHCSTEAFTQIKRVQLENTIQDYRDKLDVQRELAPHAASAAP